MCIVSHTQHGTARGRRESKRVTKQYDALIVGGGHDRLVCAFYLAPRHNAARAVLADRSGWRRMRRRSAGRVSLVTTLSGSGTI
jgi:hypothetical protein